MECLYHIAPKSCAHCPRLVAYRDENQKQYPDKYNDVVPSFGASDPRLLVVGLAPGLQGANFSGRPFTGDYAGDLLYATLLKFGLASGVYQKHKDDGLTLHDVRITNAVRCVPPQNKPTPQEMKNCLGYLQTEIAALKNLRAIVTLGQIAHQSVLKVAGARQSDYKFAHGAQHDLTIQDRHITLFNSYHCSRYNTNTGRLSESMFEDIFRNYKAFLQKEAA